VAGIDPLSPNERGQIDAISRTFRDLQAKNVIDMKAVSEAMSDWQKDRQYLGISAGVAASMRKQALELTGIPALNERIAADLRRQLAALRVEFPPGFSAELQKSVSALGLSKSSMRQISAALKNVNSTAAASARVGATFAVAAAADLADDPQVRVVVDAAAAIDLSSEDVARLTPELLQTIAAVAQMVGLLVASAHLDVAAAMIGLLAALISVAQKLGDI
jgi:hypothetical protein